MYFSRAELSQAAFGRDKNWQLATNGYRAHELVWSLFSDHPDRKRDFIFRWDTDGPVPQLYTVSERKPADISGNFRTLQTKPYDPALDEGQPLAFSLRANAVVKKRDEQGRQSVHDVVMNKKYELREAGEWKDADITQAQLVQSAGTEWLTSRQEQYGFEIRPEDILTEAYERHEFRKSKNKRRVVIATIDFQGRLRVTDPKRFKDALISGVGPSKAFGCGLLLVRPI